MTSEGKDVGDGLDMSWQSLRREGWKKQGVNVGDQVVRPGMVGPCGELVRETCTWGKRGLDDQNVCTLCKRAAWSNPLTSSCYTRTIHHKFGYAKSLV